MLKKFSTILLVLMLATGLAFIGCGGGGGDNGGELEPEISAPVIFRMSTNEGIQDLTPGVITGWPTNGDYADSPIYPLVRAGNDTHLTITAVEQNDAIALQYVTTVNWGAGIDLPFGTFGFQPGDQVTVSGAILAGGGRVQLMRPEAAEEIHWASHTGNGPFTMRFTLTQAQVNEIIAADPPALRIQARATGMTVRIDEIVHRGARDGDPQPLAAPVLSVQDTVVSWLAIDGAVGYRVYVGGALETTLGADVLSWNAHQLEVGQHVITVVAVGVTGVSLNSLASDPVTVTIETAYVPDPWLDLGSWNLQQPPNQIRWVIDTSNRERVIEEELFLLVIEVDTDSDFITDGLPGWQIAVNGFGLPWTQINAPWGDWVSTDSIPSPIVIDLSEIFEHDDVVVGDFGQILVQAHGDHQATPQAIVSGKLVNDLADLD